MSAVVKNKIYLQKTKTYQALGRNGYVWNDGISIDAWKGSNREVIRMSGITSRNTEGRAFVEIGVEDLDNFIEALKNIKVDFVNVKMRNSL